MEERFSATVVYCLGRVYACSTGDEMGEKIYLRRKEECKPAFTSTVFSVFELNPGVFSSVGR